jgi:polysaccharide biosynthesis transport protein
MDFIYLFRFLMKKKWIILGAALIASLTAFLFTRNQPKKYRSISQISTGFTLTDEIRLNANNDNFGYNDADVKFNNVLVTFTSPTVISLLSYTLILHDLEDSLPFRYLNATQRQSGLFRNIDRAEAIRVYTSKLSAMSPLNSYKPEEKELMELLSIYGYDYANLVGNLSIVRLQRTDYIQMEYQSENPELSAFVVNTVFQQFLRYYRTVKSNRSQESIDTLQSILDKKKQVLDAKNELLKDEGILNVGQGNTAKLEEIMNLNQTLTEVETKQTSDQYALQRVNQRLAALGVNTAPGKPIAPGVNNDELVTLKQAREEAFRAWINSGSSDEALRKKYETLSSQYQAKFSSSLNNGTTASTTTGNLAEDKTELLNKKNDLEVDLNAELANIQSIKQKIADLNVNLTKDASKGAALQSLLKDADLANKEYLDAKQRFNDANDVMASSVTNFRQILVGQPPLMPESSKRTIIIGFAGISALIISILILTLKTYLDSSLKTPIIFAKTVNLKLISMINFTTLKNKKLSEIIIEPGDHNDKPEYNRNNIFRESIRKLRFEVESSGKKVFLFASTKKGEGKTTIIQMLAFSLSLNKKKVLIIDTNFSNNDLTVQLNADPILEKIHPDRSNPSSLLAQVQHAAKNVIGESVYAIGSKGGDYTPSEILPRENLLHHLKVLTAEYDFIFLEGPPLNDFSDARELAQYVEGVIAVFSSRHVIKQIDKQSMSFFQELNGKFCGAILNMVDLDNVNVT